MKIFFIAACVLSLMTGSCLAQAMDQPADKMIYCLEDSFADNKAWEVHFQGDKIFTKDYIPSQDDSAEIQLTKDAYPEGKPFPYGIYTGLTKKGEEFELLVYGLDMFKTDEAQEFYVAQLFVGEKEAQSVSCYSGR